VGAATTYACPACPPLANLQVVEPPFEKPLGITIERKIKKLAEYLDKNEHRAPKASGGCCCWAFLIWLAHAD